MRQRLQPADRRHQILRATERVLARDGPANITMRAVAIEAGVSRQHLYTHFNDLGDLIEAYAGEVFGRLASIGLGAIVPGINPEDDAVAMLDFTVSLRPEQRHMMRLVHARAVIGGLERLTTAFETRMFGRWRNYQPWAHVPDGALRTLLWTTAGIVLDIADGVHHGHMERTVADEAIRRLPSMLAFTFGYDDPVEPRDGTAD